MSDLITERSKLPQVPVTRACPLPAATATVAAVATHVLRAEDSGDLKDYERVIVGYASVTGTPYAMHDRFGKYTETVARGAFAKTLAAEPNVLHRIEHEGLGISNTRSGTLTLSEDDLGLRFESVVDTRQSDARDLVLKLERGVATDTSFAFRVVEQEWSEDYSERTFLELDLERGDVASCGLGSSPHGAAAVAPVSDGGERSDQTELPVDPVEPDVVDKDEPLPADDGRKDETPPADAGAGYYDELLADIEIEEYDLV